MRADAADGKSSGTDDTPMLFSLLTKSRFSSVILVKQMIMP